MMMDDGINTVLDCVEVCACVLQLSLAVADLVACAYLGTRWLHHRILVDDTIKRP